MTDNPSSPNKPQNPGATNSPGPTSPDSPDSPSQVRVRFAPSPTGNLHIGGARTAIYNWAFARRHGGSFILRIEDTDPERSSTANTAQIIRSLRWLGLDWDEGPEVGGDFGPYLQTERFDSYHKALDKMRGLGSVYPCFCTPEALAAKREAAMAAKNYAGYDRCCREIPADAAAERIAAGQPHTWRLKIPQERGDIVFDDLVYGQTRIPIGQLDDFILMRSDGSPTYNFVAAVDDALMQVTHVIRGDDHLSNTPKQILVYEALQTPVPQFAHLSMILGADGKRLSKRHGATSVEAYRDLGYFPDALVNYLSLLGWSLDGETTVFSRQQLISNFSLGRISRNPAVFDEAKLAWLNSVYLKELGPSAFVDALLPLLIENGFMRRACGAQAATAADGTYGSGTGGSAAVDAAAVIAADVQQDRGWYQAVFALVAERAKTMQEVIPMIAYLFSGGSVVLDEQSLEKCLRTDCGAEVLRCAIDVLGRPSLSWTTADIEATLRGIPEQLGIKPKLVFQAIRVAVCGNMVSPPLFESLELLGRENVLSRLKNAIKLV